MTPEEHGDLAEQMLPYASRLACLTHGDGDAEDIQRTIARLDDTQRTALIVVLASMVDPNAQLQDVLGHVTWDEHGRPAGIPLLPGTVRALTHLKRWPETPSGAHGVLEDEQRHQAWTLAAHGESHAEIAARLGVAQRTVTRWLAERRKRVAA
ncbi:helix-turn-helix domain-containing protein [Kitasatospora sp. A2-31]|uniref:helix-turn-helix domain-containing protein n=1 Tax=Kitasatospora sp. A2-31 TaxID=2916414 RepID=UPI001EE785D7|nr:helix-turn-helix domain-containing protein [Kitasatospora sp. A2-31]MCG6493391.1 helix-turn-helix domain-containing protein [Kitasatospora sp. A2-31]